MGSDPRRWLAELAVQAGSREAAGLRRELRSRTAGDRLIDLAGNDYLGLSRHPTVLAAAAQALTGYGLGATGSRLVRGSTDLHRELESGVAALLGTEAALVYSSGYLANVGAIRALAGPGTVLVCDRYNHASLVDGCRGSGARIEVVGHRDLAAVQAVLDGRTERRAVVVTESVFSVDGDLADLPALHELCRNYDALLLVDEAHAVGVLGPSGAGVVAAAGLAGEPDIVVTATLSKAFGAAGGIVAGPAELVTHLIDTGRTFIYDTALPPPVAAGALAALALVRAGDPLRAELATRASLVGKRLAGLEVSEPAAAVISVTAPSPHQAVQWAGRCRSRGVAVGCFRPPSTPDSRSRLRLTINVGVARPDYEAAVEVVAACVPD